ncbi:aminopeptidase N [Faunimonas pinastri]|uniref:Aminopeptidase N n=1 Tax=Faunimonas pinastri TaxID=1855383 RepID=A0A1H9KZ97_9HYPH|nr:aminopeptidase N [Faunimonas pinastri]SER04524.1 aminopeptidase N [Faunimonas pinastri]
MRPESNVVVRLEDYRPTDYLIERVYLDIQLEPEAATITSRLSLHLREGTAPGTPLVLDGDALVLRRAAIDGVELAPDAFEASADRFTLRAPPAEPFELQIVTEVNPTANTELMGLYRSGGNYTTQCEAEGFRRITYFLDRPDVLAVYTTRIEASRSEAPILLGNGNPVETGDVAGTGRHYAIWHDPFPKPSYLFAMVGGDLASIHDTFRTRSGREVKLAIYCERGKESRCHYAMDSLKRSMKWDEDRFGLEYDLDVFNIVAVSDFNMGAMENKGLNVFNDKYVLVDAETGTDWDYAHVEGVIAHEYFHNWTGNRITCRDWFQLCLKEGLTVFRDQEFSSDMRSRAVKRISDVAKLREHQFPEDAGPLAHPARPTAYREINNFYTTTVYEKGAEICRMLQTILGEDGFRAGMDLYFRRHDGDAATIEDFLACFADATGTDLSQFALWYHQAGTPILITEHDYDAADETLTLRLRQILPETPDRQRKSPMHIPVAFGLVGPDGQDLSFSRATGARVDGSVIHLTDLQAEVKLEGVKARPIPSLLRGFSAPVRLETDLGMDDLLFLVGHDADPFNRWEAAQTIAMDLLKRATEEIRQGATPVFDGRFAEELGRLASATELDPAFRALALTLPSDMEVAQAIRTNVDPDAIFVARRALQTHLGDRIADALAAAAPAADASYRPDAESAGRRAFRHAAWAYGLAAGRITSADLAEAFHGAGNLTDRLAALRLAVHRDLDDAPALLEAFYERYRDDPLVLDKWFSVQATVPQHSTLERVQALSRHPAFSMKVPNRVYALIRTFAAGNPVAFNRPDGEGYRYMVDMVAEVDRHNPSVASRLTTAFRSFRMMEPSRRAAAEAALKRLATVPELSRDVSDILIRTLEG